MQEPLQILQNTLLKILENEKDKLNSIFYNLV